MKSFLFIVLLAIASYLNACSNPNHPSGTLNGTVKGSAQQDSSLDVGGLELRVRAFNPSDGFRGDHYMKAITDSMGVFQAQYRVPLPGVYPVEISREGEVLAEIMAVLSEDETIELEIGFPISDSTVSVISPENDLYRTLNRLDRNYRRVTTFLQAGVLSEDSTRMEIQKWSRLYWDFYQEYPKSVAGQLAAASSVQLLRGLDDSLMVQRIQSSLESDAAMIPGGVLLLTDFYVFNEELDKAASMIRDVIRKPHHEEHKRALYQILTRLEYDRNEHNGGERLLYQMRRDLPVDPIAKAWSGDWLPEFTRLARGEEIPSFQGWADGEVVSRETLLGNPYLIEFTRFANRRYQDELDRLSVLYQLFKPTGLEIVTFAQDISPLRKETFLDEWALEWVIADSVSPDWPELIERFNLTEAPIRILVDQEGKIYRKYFAGEFESILAGIQVLTAQQDSAIDPRGEDNSNSENLDAESDSRNPSTLDKN